jgi:CheY-like chemotaxis protein
MAADGKQIFVVEDDRFLSSLLKARLERDGYNIANAFDGVEAMNFLKANVPDLIILDLIMPAMSGFEVLEAISIDPRLNQIPVFVLTNLAQEADVQKAKRLGAKEYFVKVRSSIDQIVIAVKRLVAASPQAIPAAGAAS